MSAKRLWLVSGFVALAVSLVFLNCVFNAFVWDDEQFIVKNVFLTSWAYLPKLFTTNVVAGAGLLSNLYRPVQLLTHWLDVRVWGYHPGGHHLSTVFIHAAAAVAVFRVLVRMFPLWPATLATLLFTLHPIQSEAVAYASGRSDSLAILCVCLGLLTFQRRPSFAWLCALLGLLSKESVVLFPLFLLLYEYAVGHRTPPRRHLPFWLLSGGYVLVRLTVLNFKSFLNFYDQPNLLTEHVDYRLYTYLTTLPKGLWLWLWPMDLHHERSWSVFTTLGLPQVWGSLLAVGAWLVLSVWLRTRCRPAAAGMWWCLVATLPTSNLLVLINALFYDHWFILPGFGLALIVGCLLTRAFANGLWVRRTAGALGVVAILVSSVLTIRANRLWRDPISLYTHILAYEPSSAKIHNNLAMAYADAGRLQEAIRLYERSVMLDDHFPQTHHNLANAYLAMGSDERALEEFRRAVAIDPRFHHAWLQIGVILFKRGDLQAAADAFEHAIQAYPYAAHAYLGLAQVRLAQGDPQAAQAVLESGLRVQPHNLDLQKARATIRAARP